MEQGKPSYEELQQEVRQLRAALEEARDTIAAIRSGEIDALIAEGERGNALYTLNSADLTYRRFIEKMGQGAVTISREGTVLYCNSRFAGMVNTPLFSIIAHPFSQFVKPECQGHFEQLRERGWEEDCVGELVLENGTEGLNVLLSLTRLELDGGFAISLIITDLTIEKDTQQRLQQQNHQLEEINHALELSNHDLQQFASVASHDLQEPLRKIQMFSSLLKKKISGLPEDAHTYLNKIIASSERMKQLMDDILNYSLLSSNQVRNEYVNLQRLMEELLDDYELVIQERGASIVIGELPSIEANKGQIRQLFQNMISNAIKFSRQDVTPSISISSRRIQGRSFDAPEQQDGAFCRISIKDNGIGFDEKYINNIFSLFGRLNPRGMYEGTGIGLAIAKKIVDKHGGLITARSREGIGSEFIVVLPLQQF
jgi:signal transduction histidine kinase